MDAEPEVIGSITPTYGLRQHILSPLETLAQSISTIAPTASPTMTIPLVFGLAGNGTWLVYAIATSAVLLVALCVSRFARQSASPGSLYTYATSTLRPELGALAAWALLLAYVATGASVAGGFINYANVLLVATIGHPAPVLLLTFVAVLVPTWIAYRDVKISARLMLWIEAASITLIAIVVGGILWRHGLHFDPSQLTLKGVSLPGMRLGLVLALFSYVGFESATTLGTEAREPLRTIPRALIQSAVFVGIFFVLCAYSEVLGFQGSRQSLADSPAPLHVLAAQAGVRALGVLIDIGALVSMFACTLACLTAAARVLLLMAHNGLAHNGLRRVHHHNATPSGAVLAVGLLTLVPTAGLAACGASATDIYGWMGSLATYGFITIYALVAIALPFYLKRRGACTPWMVALSVAATAAMVLALMGTLYPVPPSPYDWLPYVFLVYLAGGLGWFLFARPRAAAGQ
jgi:amino acid transporter